jgi:hypothetical protein
MAADIDVAIENLEQFRIICTDENSKEWDAKKYSEMRAQTESWVSIFYPNDQQLWNYLQAAWLIPKDDEQWIKSRNALIMVIVSLLEKLRYRKKLEGEEKTSVKRLTTDVTEKVLSFGAEATEHKKNASGWLCRLLVIITLFGLYLFWFYKCSESFSDVAYKVLTTLGSEKLINLNAVLAFEYGRYIFLRLLTTSMFIYIIVVCLKNYNAHMHNFIVNRQRANSVNVAISMVENSTAETKNHILILVSKAIFEHQSTGYQGKDSEPANPSIIGNVVEAAKSNG